ncbi:MAG: PIG-L family deacetylase, partial [Streptomyces sp.]
MSEEASTAGPPRRLVTTVMASGLMGAVYSAGMPSASAAGRGTGARRRDPAHHDVLFVSAHPDDEAGNLSTFGLWRERRGLRTGVVTITRGEGGGNAVGPEEGAPLGMLREDEERSATALAGIENIFYLDKPDFWYTLSAPLTERIWHEQDTLERMVRLFRMATPHTVVTMEPRPFNQHGGHQTSARLAIEAFFLAGDDRAFPDQMTCEGLK